MTDEPEDPVRQAVPIPVEFDFHEYAETLTQQSASQENDARRLRAKRMGFAGIARGFAALQTKMLVDFDDSSDIKHPTEKGSAREGLLRDFLKSRRLPQRFAISDASSHVISSDGGMSKQTDIVIYDAANAVHLVDREGVQQFPVESVFGVIEVKSTLDSTTLTQALENIAAFKLLRPRDSWGPELTRGGFGIIFAFASSLKTQAIEARIAEWEGKHPRWAWPNLVVVLDRGIVVHTSAADPERRAFSRGPAFKNDDLERSGKSTAFFGYANDALLQFYLLAMDLLLSTELPQLNIAAYADLPERVGGHSVRFVDAPSSDLRECEKHGKYLRGAAEDAPSKILGAMAGPFSSREILPVLVSPDPDQDREDPQRDVYVYNPEGLPLAELLTDIRRIDVAGTQADLRVRTFTALEIDGVEFWLPFYYVLKHDLIHGCLQCGPRPRPDLTLAEWCELWRRVHGKDPEDMGRSS